ncbi:hypothetical protein [Mariniflexile sp. HMF6888]|uniref:hypothetical protein n=1 Tax=Mariniflexile sp. HMF6888 TaxID=3373086 RepID=UPI0037A7C0D8
MKKTLCMTIFIALGINYILLSQNENITINFKRNPDNTIDFYYDKKLPGSFYLNLKFSNLQNCNRFSYKGVLKNNSGSLFKLKPINNQQPIIFSYKFSYIRGTPNPKVDSLFTYSLPFKKEKAVTVLETTFLGETYFGSKAPSKWKSYVINRSYTDTVYNMRKGVVVDIINEYQTDTLVPYDYKSKMNSILIEHEDGTFASYKGFKKNTFLVKLGQTVYPQHQLGILDILNKDTYRLYFDVYYLIDKNINSKQKETLKEQMSYVEYLTPYFNTTDGVMQLKNGTNYIVDFNKTILFKEFTKREIKKYEKNPNEFE